MLYPRTRWLKCQDIPRAEAARRWLATAVRPKLREVTATSLRCGAKKRHGVDRTRLCRNDAQAALALWASIEALAAGTTFVTVTVVTMVGGTLAGAPAGGVGAGGGADQWARRLRCTTAALGVPSVTSTLTCWRIRPAGG